MNISKTNNFFFKTLEQFLANNLQEDYLCLVQFLIAHLTNYSPMNMLLNEPAGSNPVSFFYAFCRRDFEVKR